MTFIYDYAQPDTEKPVITGSKFLRIKQYSTTQGDIWESKVSGNAFMVGPESDFAGYQVVYRDDSTPTTFLNQFSITPDAPFAGLVQARNDKAGSYMPANRPGRILLYPTDWFDKNYLPPTYNPAGGNLLFVYPMVDIIQWFAPPAQMATARSDKRFFFQQVPIGAQDTFILVPFYGRRIGSVRITNRTGDAVSLALSGLNWNMGDLTENYTLTPIDTSAALADNASDTFVIDTDAIGPFDYLQLQYTWGTTTSSDIPTEFFMTDER